MKTGLTLVALIIFLLGLLVGEHVAQRCRCDDLFTPPDDFPQEYHV